MVKLILCINDNVTLKWSTTVSRSNLECIELKDVLVTIHWLSTPKEFAISWENPLRILAIDNLVDSSSIANVSITNKAVALIDWLEYSEEWMLLLQLLSLSIINLRCCISLCIRSLQLELRLSISNLWLFCLCRISSLYGLCCISNLRSAVSYTLIEL